MSSQRSSRESRGSRHSSGGGSQTSSYPTTWSEWVWNTEYNCETRYRLTARENYEYDYRNRNPGDPRSTSRIGPIAEEPYSLQDVYTTNAAATTATSREASLVSSFANTSIDPSRAQHPEPPSTRIRTINPHTSTEQFDDKYRVHWAKEFKFGRVFKVLWSEPTGNNNSNDEGHQLSVRKQHGESIYAKIRRFVIVDAREGHCICLPIMTYSRQGTNKKGVNAEDHTVIYTEKPYFFPGEKDRGMTREAIRVAPATSRDKLDEASRLNYAKPYTVECNVKVWFIGKVHNEFENMLIRDYNASNPPLLLRDTGSPTPASSLAYTGGMTENTSSNSAYRPPSTPHSTSTFTQGYTATTSTLEQPATQGPYVSNPTSAYAGQPTTQNSYVPEATREDQDYSQYDEEPNYD